MKSAVQACSPKSSNFLDISLLQSFIEHSDLNSNELAIELIQAKKILHKKDITTIAGAIQELLPLKVAFLELLKLLQMSLTLAVSIAQCERSFSSLKQIKSSLRSTMSEDRLNNLAILSIEKNIYISRFKCRKSCGCICLKT